MGSRFFPPSCPPRLDCTRQGRGAGWCRDGRGLVPMCFVCQGLRFITVWGFRHTNNAFSKRVCVYVCGGVFLMLFNTNYYSYCCCYCCCCCFCYCYCSYSVTVAVDVAVARVRTIVQQSYSSSDNSTVVQQCVLVTRTWYIHASTTTVLYFYCTAVWSTISYS